MKNCNLRSNDFQQKSPKTVNLFQFALNTLWIQLKTDNKERKKALHNLSLVLKIEMKRKCIFVNNLF